MSALRVAFVVARCGDEIVGGAESFCLQVAERARHDVEIDILTTCAIDYRTWANALPPGVAMVRNVPVHRFRVDVPRDVGFDARSRAVARDPSSASPEVQRAWQEAQGPMSSDLLAYVRDHAARYDAFVFFGYLYATTSLLLPLVARKAVLVPFAHDEWMLELPMWDAVFAAPLAIAYVSDHERALVRRRFGRLPAREASIAVDVKAPLDRDATRFRQRFGIDGPFALYVGRVDRSKGVHVLARDMRRYRQATFDPMRLVVAGSIHADLPSDGGTIVLGPLDETSKWDALEACDLVVMPSEFESLSLVVLEAWACAKPVLVNARSSVLVSQCRRSGGGVWYASYPQFAAALAALDPRTRRILGEQGRAFVSNAYAWSA